MDNKEKTKELCRSFFHAFRALETVKDDLSVIIMGKALDAFHYDGLLSSVQNDDIRVVFESDGNNDGDFENIVIKIIVPLAVGGEPVTVNGHTLKALQDSFGLHPNQISVGYYSRPELTGLCLSIYLDNLCVGVGFDWESEYDISVSEFLSRQSSLSVDVNGKD